jgi:hypothetical protein
LLLQVLQRVGPSSRARTVWVLDGAVQKVTAKSAVVAS